MRFLLDRSLRMGNGLFGIISSAFNTTHSLGVHRIDVLCEGVEVRKRRVLQRHFCYHLRLEYAKIV